MDKDYSWEDQDYEEMQNWHEFQGGIHTPKDVDSVAMQVASELIPEHLSSGEDEDELLHHSTSQTEIDAEIRDELLGYLTADEVLLVCSIRGVFYQQTTLQSLAEFNGVEVEYLLNIFRSAVAKLREIPKYAHWF